MKYIFDLDDFYDKCNVLPRLKELKKILPNLKVNLFTITNKISKELLEEAKKEDWIHLIPHGLNHDTNYECAHLNLETAKKLISDMPNKEYYQKGFKAPGWQISIWMMFALKEAGYWLAVQDKGGKFNGNPDGPFQPPVIDGLKYYALNEPPAGSVVIHGHTWEVCGNGLEALWQKLIAIDKDSEFLFINDII